MQKYAEGELLCFQCWIFTELYSNVKNTWQNFLLNYSFCILVSKHRFWTMLGDIIEGYFYKYFYDYATRKSSTSIQSQDLGDYYIVHNVSRHFCCKNSLRFTIFWRILNNKIFLNESKLWHLSYLFMKMLNHKIIAAIKSRYQTLDIYAARLVWYRGHWVDMQ